MTDPRAGFYSATWVSLLTITCYVVLRTAADLSFTRFRTRFRELAHGDHGCSEAVNATIIESISRWIKSRRRQGMSLSGVVFHFFR
ncbi:hypothetical protein V8C34DRAFT_269509 [Trichoderma compactum]